MLGSGSFGTVTVKDGKAVKQLSIIYDDGEEYSQTKMLQLFVREVAALASLRDNENIVNITGFDWKNRTISMEPGEKNLIQYMQEVQKEERDTHNIMSGLINGLRAIHKQGIWHRDIKSGNVVVKKGGGIMIVDFGSAKFGTFESIDHTNPIGTLHYRPPELLKHDTHFYDGSKADIYAAGIIFWELLAPAGDANIPQYKPADKNESREMMREKQLSLIEKKLGIKGTCDDLKECTPTCERDQHDVDYKHIVMNIKKVIQGVPDETLTVLAAMIHPNPTMRAGHKELCSLGYTKEKSACEKIDTWHPDPNTTTIRGRRGGTPLLESIVIKYTEIATMLYNAFETSPVFRGLPTILFINGLSIAKTFLKIYTFKEQDMEDPSAIVKMSILSGFMLSEMCHMIDSDTYVTTLLTMLRIPKEKVTEFASEMFTVLGGNLYFAKSLDIFSARWFHDYKTSPFAPVDNWRRFNTYISEEAGVFGRQICQAVLSKEHFYTTPVDIVDAIYHKK
jgi:serine/threonine protein kinase